MHHGFGNRHWKLQIRHKPLWIHGWCNPTSFLGLDDAFIAYKKALAFPLAASLAACSKKKDLSEGRRLHAEIRLHGLLENNRSLGNKLLILYAKCGAILEAQQVFGELPIRDIVSWNVLISAYNQNGQGKTALETFDWMRREGMTPDLITYACVLKACGISKQVDRGKQVHDEIVDRDLLGNSAVLGNALIDMYAKCRTLSKAQQVLNELPFPDVVSWNALLTGYVQSGQGKEARDQYERMQKEGVCPDAFTYACILKTCGILKEVDKGRQIHGDIVSKGLLERSFVLGNALVDLYAKCGMLSEAHQVLDELHVRDVVSWSALIVGYSQEGRGTEALDCYDRMLIEGLSADAITYSCILKACGMTRSAERGKQVHEEIVKQGLLERNVVLGTAVVDMYCKCGLLSLASQVHAELAVHNVVSWSALIAGYAQHGQGEEALDCYEQMRKESMCPDVVTYACILKACGITNELGRGKQIHDEIISQGIMGKSIVLGTALVDMYAKCGVLMKAAEVLEELPVRNVVSWNALISGYAQQGKGQEALNCFQRMRSEGHTPNRVSWNAVIGGYAQQGRAEDALGCFHSMQHEGITPDSITYVSMLTACSHSGRVDDGETYFENMKRNHGITPDLEHHTCLIDLFARTGHFDKAVTVLRKLPSFDYLPVWSALLGACWKWGNVQLGRLAFEQAVHLDEADAVAHIFIENNNDGGPKIATLGAKIRLDSSGSNKRCRRTLLESFLC